MLLAVDKEQTALAVTKEREIRTAWREEKVIVAADVSDDDFEKLKGKTTLDVFNMLHTKQPEPAAEPKPAQKGGKK